MATTRSKTKQISDRFDLSPIDFPLHYIFNQLADKSMTYFDVSWEDVNQQRLLFSESKLNKDVVNGTDE